MVAGHKHLGYLSLLSQAVNREQDWEQAGLEPTPTQDTDSAGRGLACYTAAAAPGSFCFYKLVLAYNLTRHLVFQGL